MNNLNQSATASSNPERKRPGPSVENDTGSAKIPRMDGPDQLEAARPVDRQGETTSEKEVLEKQWARVQPCVERFTLKPETRKLNFLVPIFALFAWKMIKSPLQKLAIPAGQIKADGSREYKILPVLGNGELETSAFIPVMPRPSFSSHPDLMNRLSIFFYLKPAAWYKSKMWYDLGDETEQSKAQRAQLAQELDELNKIDELNKKTGVFSFHHVVHYEYLPAVAHMVDFLSPEKLVAKAMENEQLFSSIREMKKKYEDDFKQLKDQLEQAKATQSQQEVDKLRKKLDKKREKLAAKKASLKEEKEKRRSAKAASKLVKREMDEMTRNQLLLLGKLEDTEKAKEELEKENGRLQAEARRQEEELNSAKKENAELVENLFGEHLYLEEAQKELVLEKKKNACLQKELDSEKIKSAAFEEQLMNDELIDTLLDEFLDKEWVQEELALEKKKNAKLQKELDSARSKSACLEEQLLEKADLQRQLQAARDQLTRAGERENQLLNGKAKNEEDHASLSCQFHDLQNLLNSQDVGKAQGRDEPMDVDDLDQDQDQDQDEDQDPDPEQNQDQDKYPDQDQHQDVGDPRDHYDPERQGMDNIADLLGPDYEDEDYEDDDDNGFDSQPGPSNTGNQVQPRQARELSTGSGTAPEADADEDSPTTSRPATATSRGPTTPPPTRGSGSPRTAPQSIAPPAPPTRRMSTPPPPPPRRSGRTRTAPQRFTPAPLTRRNPRQQIVSHRTMRNQRMFGLADRRGAPVRRWVRASDMVQRDRQLVVTYLHSLQSPRLQRPSPARRYNPNATFVVEGFEGHRELRNKRQLLVRWSTQELSYEPTNYILGLRRTVTPEMVLDYIWTL